MRANARAQAWAKLHLSFEAIGEGGNGDAHQYLTGGINSDLEVRQGHGFSLGCACECACACVCVCVCV